MNRSITQRLRGMITSAAPLQDQLQDTSGRQLEMPINEASYVVIDTELTGLKLKQDSIVSVGAIAMTGGRIEVGRTFYRVVEPRTELRGSSVIVHGIMPSEVRALPVIGQVLPEFMEFCGDSVVVGHFLPIDLGFLNEELVRARRAKMRNPAVDTLVIHRWLQEREEVVCAYYGGSADPSDLFALAKRHGIPVSGAHNALNDAFVTAQLFQRFLSMLPGRGVKTIRDLVRIGSP
jgi:DNA polymerase III subunit epsilon